MPQHEAKPKKEKLTNLGQVLDRIEDTAQHHDPVSLRNIVEEFGRRSFAPLLLLAGLITLAPGIGDIPGVPTLMAILVLSVAGQMLFQRTHLWLPNWLLNRSVSSSGLTKGVGWLRHLAHFTDRLLHQRLNIFTGMVGNAAIAMMCILIALALPPMELIPFSANGAGLALTTFGLALIAHDGLTALLAFCFSLATLGFVFYSLI